MEGLMRELDLETGSVILHPLPRRMSATERGVAEFAVAVAARVTEALRRAHDARRAPHVDVAPYDSLRGEEIERDLWNRDGRNRSFG
jgi:hypothetical protein